jgi:SAM-dependent methyltransferase
MAQASFANPLVLEFYKQLPFNHPASAEEQAASIRQQDEVPGYPILLPLVRPGVRVLEVGCGTGWLALSLSLHHGCAVTAIDFNPVAIERARSVASILGQDVQFEVADLFLYEPSVTAELVLSIGVLHHTDNCLNAIERLCTRFVRQGGHLLIGLYHAFGRRPFLEHFARLKAAGLGEDELFEEYCRLHSWLEDGTSARSWFRDQVLHPHETQHTLAELVPVLDRCGMTLAATSINKFAAIDRIDALFEIETGLDQIGRAALARGTYYPGFFLVLAKKAGDGM